MAQNKDHLTMVCGEVSILLANVLKCTGGRIDDLDVASHVFVSPNLAEIVEAGWFQSQQFAFSKGSRLPQERVVEK